MWSLSVTTVVLLVIMHALILCATFITPCIAVVPVVVVAISLGGYKYYLSNTL
jgi:hypothetical protein